MNNTIPMRIRASRFLSERYYQRERPGAFADLFLWGVIIILATWPMFLLIYAMERLR